MTEWQLFAFCRLQNQGLARLNNVFTQLVGCTQGSCAPGRWLYPRVESVGKGTGYLLSIHRVTLAEITPLFTRHRANALCASHSGPWTTRLELWGERGQGAPMWGRSHAGFSVNSCTVFHPRMGKADCVERICAVLGGTRVPRTSVSGGGAGRSVLEPIPQGH